jgi:hypothetical protein
MRHLALRAAITAAILLACSFVSLAHASEEEGKRPEAPASRPVRHASVEFNPLALLAGRTGGQVQVGLVGPLALVGSASRLSLGGDQRWSDYDKVMRGDPALTAWCFELGPRAYLPVSWGRVGRVDLWVGAAYLHDQLHEGGVQSGPVTGGHGSTAPPKDARRDGFAMDFGVQLTAKAGVYLLTGLGYQWVSDVPLSTRPSSDWDVGLDEVQKGRKWPRLTLAFGVGF